MRLNSRTRFSQGFSVSDPAIEFFFLPDRVADEQSAIGLVSIKLLQLGSELLQLSRSGSQQIFFDLSGSGHSGDSGYHDSLGYQS